MDTREDTGEDKNQNSEHQDSEAKPEIKDIDDLPANEASGASVLPQVHGIHLKGKKKLPIALAVIAVLALGIGAYFYMNKDSEPVADTVTQTTPKLGVAVTVVDGTAKYSKDGTAWENLTTDYQPVESDLILTEAGSRVVLTLDDGSAVRLDELTTVKLVSLDADNVQVDNMAGEVYSRVVASERSYQVHVDDTDYKALGTAYKTVNTTTEKGVLVYHSTVSVEGTETKVTEGKQFYRAHSNAALTQGVTDVSVDEMKSDEFMVWNLEQDKQSEEFKDKLGYLTKIEEQPAPPPAPAPATASIKLSGKVNEKGAALSWTVSNIGTVEGFKVVRSKKTTTPTYGKDEASYASGASTRSFVWKDGSGITYNYRVCGYINKTCTIYSNSVSVTSPYTPPEAVVPGTVTLSISGTQASWTFTGTAPHGFKIVVGNSANPTYGDNIKKYYSESSPINLTGLDPGTYHVRVCKYTADSSISGGCTDYSNDEEVIIP